MPRLCRCLGLNKECARALDLDGIALPLAGEHGDQAEDGPAEWLSDWLRFYGPREKTFLSETLPLSEADLVEALEDLVASRAVVP